MEYYKLLQLDREPFSNSPDPDYFFQSHQHLSCIQKLEVALRLKRGLNVVIGDVGTGKTTICREIIRRLAEDLEFETHLILDPAIHDADKFLGMIHDMLCGHVPSSDASAIEIKEAIKQTLFRKGVEEEKTVILIIDEGQKLPPAGMEILRELLNYETNTHKLLQIAIFAQQEFVGLIEAHPNFADRINLLHHLAPMNFSDTCRMIHYRLKLASSTPRPLNLFTFPALLAIYSASKGYPRRIIHLCHQSILTMIIQNRRKAGWALIRSCKQRLGSNRGFSFRRKGALTAVLIICLVFIGVLYAYPRLYDLRHSNTQVFSMPAANHATAASAPSMTNNADDTTIKVKQEVTPAIDTKGVETSVVVNNDSIPIKNTTIQPAKPFDSTTVSSEKDEAKQPLLAMAKPENFNAEAAPSSLDSNAPLHPPPLIGDLTVRRGDTLYKLISSVYGEYREIYLNNIMKANPHITDPNSIASGQTILFPAIEFFANPLLSQCHWIVIGKEKNLKSAFGRIKKLTSQTHIPAQLLAGWTDDGQLSYYLIIKGYFATREKAGSFLELLPASLSSNAAIIPDWPSNLTLFGDPYVGGVR